MLTKLIEFPNLEKQNLRGILTLPDGEISQRVICLHGFERCSSTEKRFKVLADRLTELQIATLRFDFSGCGLSDGDFRKTTAEKQGEDFLNAIEALRQETGNGKINVVAHSFGNCVLATQIEKVKEKIGKMILMGPALNQKDLLRYWFVTNKMKKIKPELEINWQNYREYLDENEFLTDCQKTDKVAKINYIDPPYFLTGKDIDYSNVLAEYNERTLHVHGNKDVSVPMESLNTKFSNQLIVDGGDHDLEKPMQLKQWLEKVIGFLGE